MPAPSDFGDGATVIDASGSTGYAHAKGLAPGGSSHGKEVESSPVTRRYTSTFAKTPDYFAEERPFVVAIGKRGAMGALQDLDERLRQAGHNKILSDKVPTDWIGKELAPGRIGLINHGGLPKLLTKPGRYPAFPFRNWWARTFNGTRGCKRSRALRISWTSANRRRRS